MLISNGDYNVNLAPRFFQIDLRDDPKTIAKLNDMKEKPIATEQGQKLAKEVCMFVGLKEWSNI